MQTITTIGLDIAKSVFQVHGVDANGEVVIRRQVLGPPPFDFPTKPYAVITLLNRNA
jgi:transposase